MAESKEKPDKPVFNLPPLPKRESLPSPEKKAASTEKSKTKESGEKENEKIVPKVKTASAATPPNIATLKGLIMIIWLFFFICILGIAYVIARYKRDRDALKKTGTIIQ